MPAHPPTNGRSGEDDPSGAVGDVAGLAPVARAVGADLVVQVQVQPGARRPAIVGRHGDVLRVRVASPPERGRANAEVVEVIAAALGVGRAEARLERGGSSRRKVVRIRGGATPAVVHRLHDLLRGDGARPGS